MADFWQFYDQKNLHKNYKIINILFVTNWGIKTAFKNTCFFITITLVLAICVSAKYSFEHKKRAVTHILYFPHLAVSVTPFLATFYFFSRFNPRPRSLYLLAVYRKVLPLDHHNAKRVN